MKNIKSNIGLVIGLLAVLVIALLLINVPEENDKKATMTANVVITQKTKTETKKKTKEEDKNIEKDSTEESIDDYEETLQVMEEFKDSSATYAGLVSAGKYNEALDYYNSDFSHYSDKYLKALEVASKITDPETKAKVDIYVNEINKNLGDAEDKADPSYTEEEKKEEKKEESTTTSEKEKKEEVSDNAEQSVNKIVNIAKQTVEMVGKVEDTYEKANEVLDKANETLDTANKVLDQYNEQLEKFNGLRPTP